MCIRHKIDKNKAKEIGEGYKIIYSAETSTTNSIGVMVDEEMKGRAVEVVMKNDGVMVMVKL